MAHAIFVAEVEKRSLPVEVFSAGVYDFSDASPIEATSMTCLKHETPAPEKAPTWVGDLPLESIDRFLVMEHGHADALIHYYGVSRDRINLLGEFDPKQRGHEIADPYGQGKIVYDDSYKLIRDCIESYLDREYDQSASQTQKF